MRCTVNALVIGQQRLGTELVSSLCLDASKGTGAVEGLLFARLLMRQHVYGHKTTRAYEAELIQALRLALRLKGELPEDTPAPARELLKERGNVGIKAYLMLDDEVMWWALRRWAAWRCETTTNEHLGTALRRHARRLVRREEPWKTIPVRGRKAACARKLIESLSEKDDRLRYERYLDNLQDLPYKDYGILSERADEEEAYFGQIFLARKDGSVESLSEMARSGILKGLTQPLQIQRFHYDRDFSQEFSGLLEKFGVC